MPTYQVFFTQTSVIIFRYSLYFHLSGQVTFNNDVANIDWLDILQANNPDIAYDLFITKIKTIYERCFPLSTARIIYKETKQTLDDTSINYLMQKKKNYINSGYLIILLNIKKNMKCIKCIN